MSISRFVIPFARKLILAAPLAALPISAASVPVLSANCAFNASAYPSDPPSCTTSVSEGHVSQSLQYFSNGFTMSLFANGTAWTSNGQGGAFSLDAEDTLHVNIAGPSRDIVVVRDGSQTETLETNSGTVGQALYGLSHFTVISKAPDGGDAISFNYSYAAPTVIGTVSLDNLLNESFGLSMQLTGMVTDGALFASMSSSETLHFYEADGVTPVALISDTPEPASVFLLLGGAGVCFLASRRKRSQAVRCN
jgi:hypothetical protein